MKKTKSGIIAVAALLFVLFVMCSCVSSTTVSTEVKKVPTKQSTINKTDTIESPALKKIIAVSRFSVGMADRNASYAYAQAAYDSLVNRLQASGKFIVFEERDFDTLEKYVQSTGGSIKKRLAQYMIVGSINEVATKKTGSSALGITSTKTTVEASVTIRLIDTSTGQVIYAEEGSGSSNNNKTSVNYKGFGVSASGYDPKSLESTAISAAIDSLIDNIIVTCSNNPWSSDIFFDNTGNCYLIGGASIGIKAGKVFDIYKRGAKITNPQTGSLIELPGEKVGEATVVQTLPAGVPEDELSLVVLNTPEVTPENTSEYLIKEKI